MVKIMKKIFLVILFANFINISYASNIVTPTVYPNNGTVTAANLNGNFTAVNQIVNGGLDNTNANTTQGYRFYQTVSNLPSAGNQGATYFLTSDNTLNFDTGSIFNKSVSLNSPVNGNIPYYNSGWTELSVGTSANNIVQLDASDKLPAVNGSQLTNLPIPKLGTIDTLNDNQTYTASNDGFVIATATSSSGGVDFARITIVANGSTYLGISGTGGLATTVTVPVKKGNTYNVKIDGTGTPTNILRQFYNFGT